jgi:L-lactate dehydrogenase complex protein LldE
VEIMPISCEDQGEVHLFVTCLVDLFRPSIGFAAVKLIEQNGWKINIPNDQVCCGQPAYNSGNVSATQEIAKNIINSFSNAQYVVVPSGSCAGMLKHHYPKLFKGVPEWQEKAESLATKVYELTDFLRNKCNYSGHNASYAGQVTIHDSCSALREMGVKQQPRDLLSSVKDVKICEHDEAEVCCGFGGTFCVKYADISNNMVTHKVDSIVESGADTVVASDLGCLMNIAGKLKRQGSDIKVRHIAEVLVAGDRLPAIGEGKS